ncbi:Pdc2p-like protein [Leptotrombidium deliense]|uniref:Pdc2p-like protein n=1 Tax=Leptotrombidium deliense TaxID=299467 RepID=A0A443SVA5_9ACAR|nr:Pdc2p-like protein [Leptotrombidium deliense]
MGRKGEKHSSLTFAQKRELVLRAKSEPRLTQQMLAQWANETFQTNIKRSTVSVILKTFDESKYHETENPSSKRTREVTFPKFDEALRDWALEFGDPTEITDSMIIEKGKEIAEIQQISEDALTFSSGWLSSFKKRHSVGHRKEKERTENSLVCNNVEDKISITEAIEMCDNLHKYFAQQNENKQTQLELIRIVKNDLLTTQLKQMKQSSIQNFFLRKKLHL